MTADDRPSEREVIAREPTAAMIRSARHLAIWWGSAKHTERDLLRLCRAVGITPPPDCDDHDAVPPVGVALGWIWRAMHDAAGKD